MISPIGSETLNALFVADDSQRNALIEEAQNLPSLLVSSATAANAVMLGGGYFNPLTGYMNLADAINVANTMTMTSGQFFPGKSKISISRGRNKRNKSATQKMIASYQRYNSEGSSLTWRF